MRLWLAGLALTGLALAGLPRLECPAGCRQIFMIGDLHADLQCARRWLERTGLVQLDPLSGEPTWTGKSWKTWQESGHDQHSEFGDPRWLDPAHPAKGVHADSPALKLGIEVPVITDAGPRPSPAPSR